MILDGCERCDHGWQLIPDHGEFLHPMPPDPSAGQIDATKRAQEWHRTAVVPCIFCRPNVHARWRNGCFRPNHVRLQCGMCP